MHFFYGPSDGSKFNHGLIARLDPTSCYLKHFENTMFLNLVLRNSKDFKEKYQANKEMAIAEKKMSFWSKRPGFDMERAIADSNAIKKKWEQT